MASVLNNKPKVIESLEKVVNEHQCRKIQGQLVDVQTANAIITVYNALSDENKASYSAFKVDKMASVAWKLLSSK